jgi:hypothetical protein
MRLILIAAFALMLTACPANTKPGTGIPGGGSGGSGGLTGAWQGTVTISDTSFSRRLKLTEANGQLSGDYEICAADFSQCERASGINGQRTNSSVTIGVSENTDAVTFTGTTESTRSEIAGTVQFRDLTGSFSFKKK